MSTKPQQMAIASRKDFVDATELATRGGAVAIALTDLDGFGPLNDELGHDAGDAVLAAWNKTLIGSLPKNSVVRRIGGDEYAIALPNNSAENALILLDEIREHVASHPVDGIGRVVTATFGIAARPPHASDIEDVVRCADAALMRGKREGGNQVALYIDEKMVLKSNYYPREGLDRLARVAASTSRTEASLLREALDDLFGKYRST
jgi:diguanylate cyclase